MFTKNELDEFTPNSSTDCETHLLKVFGSKKNGKVTRIQLDDKTLNLDKFVQFLYFSEWEVLTEFLLFNLPTDCEFKLEGTVMRCVNGIGSLGLASIITE